MIGVRVRTRMLAGIAPALLVAAPTPTPTPPASPALIGPQTPGTPVCTVTDERITEASGLVATGSGYVVINDGTSATSSIRLFLLDRKCKVTTDTRYRDPNDIEDLAVGKDGAYWVGDIGDNDEERDNVTFWKVPAEEGERPIRYRVKYPDGAHNAEAFVLDDNDRPVIITKGVTAGIYRADEPLSDSGTVTLTRAGTFTPVGTGTPNPYSVVGEALVTGAARSPDGKRVVIRTYSDAYEFDISNGEIPGSIVSNPPRITPLPNEPQGESIAYSRDGKQFLTISEKPDDDSDDPVRILAYTPFAPAPATTAPPEAADLPPKPRELGWLDRISLHGWTMIVGGFGLFGFMLALAGVFGIRQSRRRQASQDALEESTQLLPTVPSNAP